MASEIKTEVLIVGAGVAGLCAARALTAAGVGCLLVEARSYVGGRIRTEQLTNGDAVELGAEFVHGRAPRIFKQAERAGLEIVEMSRPSWMSRDGHLQRAEDLGENSDEVFRELESYAGADVSFSAFVKQSRFSEAARRQATRYIEGFNAADGARVSVLALQKQQRAEDAIAGDRIFHVAGGYGELVQSLEQEIAALRCEFLMEARVEAIAWKNHAVRAQAVGMQHGHSFEIHARAALITVPLSCWQQGTIMFDPPLEEKRGALAGLAMGEVVRIALEFRSAFWREQAPDMGFLFAADEKDFSVFWAGQRPASTVITAWSSALRAQPLLELTPAVVGERALAALGRIFKSSSSQLRDLLISAHFHDWTRDLYSQGAYSYVLVGGEDAPHALAKPLGGTLFFAGEHTESEGHHATVHGAMSTGERAAREILAMPSI